MSTAEPLQTQGAVPADSFAVRLRILRYDLGRLSVEEIAAKCGIKTATWSTWENGSLPRNMPKAVKAIAEATGYDSDWLMWGGPLEVSGRYMGYAQVSPALDLVHYVGPDQMTIDDAPRYDRPAVPCLVPVG